MTEMSRDLTPPKPTIADDAHTMAQAAASALIPAGDYLVEAVFGKPIEKRLSAWRCIVADTLRELLEREQVTVESLQEDPQFVDAVMYASRAAAYTSSQEKRQALRNAVYNSAIKRGPDDDERLAFIRMVDELTEWHIRLLDISNDPQILLGMDDRRMMPTRSTEKYPELLGRNEYYNQLLSELEARGLVNHELHHVLTDGEWNSVEITNRGKALLAFITRPEDETPHA